MIGVYINNWIFGREKLENIVKRVSKMGFDGIELVGEPSIYSPSQVNYLMEEYGLKVISICGMFPGPQKDDLRALCHPDKVEREKAIDYVKRCVDLAKGVKARSVLIVPSLVGKPAFFENKKTDLNRATESIVQASKHAENNNIILTIEPINRYEVGLVNSINDAIKLAKRVNTDALRTMGDTFHMQIEERGGIPNAIRKAGKRWFQHLHIADNTRQAPGIGTMDWKEIIRALYDIKYEGGISLEPLPSGSSPYDAREGNIPQEIMDKELSFGLRYLKMQEKIVLGEL